MTFGSVSGFDRHRRGGECLSPSVLGMADNGRGVFRVPMSMDSLARIAPSACHLFAESAQEGSGVDRDRAGDSHAF